MFFGVYLSNSWKTIRSPLTANSVTSSFNAYTKEKFDDVEQERLKNFCLQLATEESLWMQSNSDPGNGYFQKLYGRNYHIEAIQAKRSIGSDGTKRNPVGELLIRNYR